MIVYWIIEQDREGPQQPPATTLLRAGLAALHSGQKPREKAQLSASQPDQQNFFSFVFLLRVAGRGV